LHRILSEHLATFLARIDADETRAGLPRRVRRELWSHLRCGVLAPASSWRDWIVPTPEPAVEDAKGSVQVTGAAKQAPTEPCAHLDVLRCEHCGERRKLIALITNLLVARRILSHLGLDCDPPPIAKARPPPQASFAY
jgi:hypothetical protein